MSLWHIKGRLKDLIDYVENPEKTMAKTPEEMEETFQHHLAERSSEKTA